jgi:Sel1 repeat
VGWLIPFVIGLLVAGAAFALPWVFPTRAKHAPNDRASQGAATFSPANSNFLKTIWTSAIAVALIAGAAWWIVRHLEENAAHKAYATYQDSLYLGTMYARSMGVPEDAEALTWYRLAAADGNAAAQLTLGVMYDHGEGVPQNFAEAMKWYRLAADQGLADAQLDLGLMYARGEGVVQDYAEAMKWYHLAADQGLAEAQYSVGTMYARGEGVSQDYVRAHMWFNLAVSQYPASEKEKRDEAVKARDSIAVQMTSAQISTAENLAREWKGRRQK